MKITMNDKTGNVMKRTVRLLGTAFFILHSSFFISCGEKDELMEEPSWLGNSIYDRLSEEGNYRYTLRLIDDLEQRDVLSQTGSKTLFVANDDVYDQFFSQKTWGAGSYDRLTMAQKKLLFNSAMVNNAYLIELLSSVSGPKPLKGQCMRRPTAASVFDSVTYVTPDRMPDTKYWQAFREAGKPIVLLRDNTAKPMIHFLPVFMRNNKITDEDLSILTNGVSTSTGDSWVNGKKLTEIDITCKNGYIHKVDGLPTAADNMAEIVHNHSNMSLFASLLDRFSAPYYDEEATKEFNRLYNNNDKVFTLKYFSQNSNTKDYPESEGGTLDADPDGQPVEATLAFDPGWNQYMYSNTAGRDLHYDAGALLVPSNEALNHWWTHDGESLKDMYGAWENVPMKVLVKLLDINLVRSFTETVPSKFKNIVDNTNKVPIGLKKEHVDSCFMGCNGVVYLLNRVFTPAAYSSVSFPALVNENTMNVIYWAIEKLEFEPYLNSMDSYYSFIIPTNTAMLTYVDPCTYGGTTSVLYEFYWDDVRKTVGAHRYNYDLVNGVKMEGELNDANDNQVQNRLRDLLDNLIIIDTLESGHRYYRTKGGSTIRVENAGLENTMTIAGGLQIEQGKPIAVKRIYDQTQTGNGKSYVVDDQLPLGSRRSLYSLLSGRENCARFFELLTQGGATNTLMKNRMGGYTCADYNCSLFDAYDYTVYVPADADIDRLHEQGYLPYWSDYEALADTLGEWRTIAKDAKLLKEARKIVANRIMDFVKYHIQDNSVCISGTSVHQVKYETSTLNPKNKRFYSVQVTADDHSLSISDLTGNTRHVIATDGCYNLMGREYWIQNANNANHNEMLYNASDVVVHQIDGPLLYDEKQLTSWKEEVMKLKIED